MSHEFIIERVRAFDDNRLDPFLSDYELLNGKLLEYVAVISNSPPMLSENMFLDRILFKIYLTNRSIQQEHVGQVVSFPNGNEKITMLNHSSIHALNRMQYESIFLLLYLYCNPANRYQKEFRLKLYHYSGIHRRTYFPASKFSQSKKVEAIKTRDALRDEIENHGYFKSLHPSKQKKLKSGEYSKEMGFDQIIEESNLDKTHFHTMWKRYSAYAHSEYLEFANQGVLITNKTMSSELVSSNLFDTLALLAVCISRIEKLCITYDLAIDQSKFEMRVLKFYTEIGTKITFDGDK